jgi:hypothetical protein
MRNLFRTLTGVGLLCLAVGCTEGELICGYCDCDPGYDRCSYYYGHGFVSNYHPLAPFGTTALPESAPAPQPEAAPAPQPQDSKPK